MVVAVVPPAPDRLISYMRSSPIPLSLADLRLPDMPLIAVNEGFCRIAGYAAEEALGRNCRFLQPREGGGPVRRRVRELLAHPLRAEGEFVVGNQRKSGEPFLNLLYLVRVMEGGRPILAIGSQFDLTAVVADKLDAYHQVLNNDIRGISELCSSFGLSFLGSCRSLSASVALIARASPCA